MSLENGVDSSSGDRHAAFVGWTRGNEHGLYHKSFLILSKIVSGVGSSRSESLEENTCAFFGSEAEDILGFDHWLASDKACDQVQFFGGDIGSAIDGFHRKMRKNTEFEAEGTGIS